MPALALTTYWNWKLSGFLGRSWFRLRVSGIGTRLKLGLSLGVVGITIVTQNFALGLLRGGVEVSLPSILRALTDPMTLAPAVTMPAVTMMALGWTLAAYIAWLSFQKEQHGFTPEYAQLRAEAEEAEAAVDEAFATHVDSIDRICVAASGSIDDALNDQVCVLAHAKESSNRLNTAKRQLCRRLVATVHAWQNKPLNDYNRQVAATWGRRGAVPDIIGFRLALTANSFSFPMKQKPLPLRAMFKCLPQSLTRCAWRGVRSRLPLPPAIRRSKNSVPLPTAPLLLRSFQERPPHALRIPPPVPSIPAAYVSITQAKIVWDDLEADRSWWFDGYRSRNHRFLCAECIELDRRPGPHASGNCFSCRPFRPRRKKHPRRAD